MISALEPGFVCPQSALTSSEKCSLLNRLGLSYTAKISALGACTGIFFVQNCRLDSRSDKRDQTAVCHAAKSCPATLCKLALRRAKQRARSPHQSQ